MEPERRSATPAEPNTTHETRYEDLDDRELLERYRRGSVRAFEAFLSRHEGGLIRYVARWSGDENLAQDVVQDTFLRLIRTFCTSDLPEAPRAWLYQVARNRARDVWKQEARMRARQQSVATHEATEPYEKQYENHEEACSLSRHLESLPPEVVEALSLKVLDGMSYREIATVTGHSLGKVSNLIHQGLSQLGRQLAAGAGKGGAQ